MPAFVNGTVVTLVLDEFDILTTDGQANLSVTPTGHPTYQTQTIGHQVIGPFGIITTVVLTGAGAGTYVAGPSNQPQHVLIVDISAAQQASPTSDMLAATGTLFQLNTAPYTIYQSTGTALTQLGGESGGVSTFAALSDAATANLPVTNAPLAAALAAAGAPAQSVAYSTTIPLDTAGNGKYMPQTTLNANSTFTVGGSPIEQGNCNFSLVGNGSNVPVLSAFTNANGYSYSSAAGANNIYSAVYSYGTPLLYGQLGATVITVPGQVTGLTAGSSSGTNQVLTWTAPATGGAPADYLVQYRLHGAGGWTTFSHSVSTLTTQTVTGLSINTSYDYQVAGVNSAGTGTFSTTLTVSTLALPGQPTALTLGAVSSSTQALTWTAPGSGGAVVSYLVEFRTTVGPGAWTSGGTPSVTSATVLGLAASTSYDYRVTAVNAAGSGTASTTVTGVTSSAGGSLTQSSQTIGTTLDLNALGYRDYFYERASTGSNLQKTARPFISNVTVTNMNLQAASGTWPSLTATDWVDAGSGSGIGTFTDSSSQRFVQSAAGANSVVWTIPAGTASQTVRVHFGGQRIDAFTCPGRCKLTATLSDASAGPLSITNAAPSGDNVTVAERHDIVFNAASNGQTLTLTFEAASGGTTGDFICVQLIALV